MNKVLNEIDILIKMLQKKKMYNSIKIANNIKLRIKNAKQVFKSDIVEIEQLEFASIMF